MEGNNAPVIRFNGFNAAWEQRKLSDLTDRVSIQSSDSDLPQVEYEDIISGEGTLNKDLRDKEGGKTGIKFYAGDVLYGKLRPYLMNWLYPQFNGVAVGDFWVLRATECDSSFLYRLIQTDSFQRLANVSSGSKMPRADWNLISQSFFAVPADHAEQKAIAKSLSELDNLITLHQIKCDKLVKLKSAMLNRMFPKPGDSEPEIRFSGFKEPWERCKLGDVAAIARGERFTAADYVESGGIPCIHYGEIYTSYGTIATKTFSQVSSSLKDSLRYAKQGDVIVAATSENVEDVCKAVVWMGNSPVAYHDDSFALTFSGDPIFLVSFFETPEFFAQKSSAAHGVKVMRVSSDSLADVDLPLPSAAEQRLIGTCFAKLDNLITLHRRKIKGLEKIKSAMLEKMFV